MMQSPNDELSATLQKQIDDLTEIDLVLAADDFPEYLRRYAQFRREFPSRGYRSKEQAPWDLLFNQFEFQGNNWDLRARIFNRHYQDFAFQFNSSIFHDLLTDTFNSIHAARNPRTLECDHLRELIASQITALRRDLASRMPAESNQNSNPTTMSQPLAPAPLLKSFAIVTPAPPQSCLSQNCGLLITGSTLMSASLLLQLNPSFGLLIGLHLSPPLFVLVFVIGGAMAIYGISRKESGPSLIIDPVRTSSMLCLGGQQVEQYLKFCFRFGRSRSPDLTVAESPSNASDPNAACL